MIITEIQYFFSKIIRFQAIFKDTVEFTCALEFKISSQLFFLPRLPSAVPGILRHFPCRSILDTDGRKNVARFLKKKNANGTVLSNSP